MQGVTITSAGKTSIGEVSAGCSNEPRRWDFHHGLTWATASDELPSVALPDFRPRLLRATANK
jgi:hypothetical protein